MTANLSSFTDVLGEEIPDSQPISLPSSVESRPRTDIEDYGSYPLPAKGTGQVGSFRSVEELDPKYRNVFTYQYFNLVQSNVIDDALYSDKSMVVCAPTGSGKTVIFEMAIVQLLMDLENKNNKEDFKIIYMAPVKALCTERLSEWYSKFNKFGLLCIEVTGDTDVDFGHLQPYKIIITTPEKWDMLTRRWRDHRGLVEMVKLFLIDEVHILNDEARGPVLEAVVSRMKTIESAAQSAHRIEKLQKQYQTNTDTEDILPSKISSPPRIRFVAVSATVSNPEDVAIWLGNEDKPAVFYKVVAIHILSLKTSSPPRIQFVAVSATVSNPENVAVWLGNEDKPAVFYKFGDECRPVKINRVVEGYPCPDGTSIFKFDIILNYKLWPIIQKYHNGKPTLIFCNTRKSVLLTAEALSREITITFNPEQKAKLTALASTIKNKKLQSLVLAGVGCHHAGMLYEERFNIEHAFRNRDLPILITTTTLAMGVNLPAHLVIVKNTQQYVNGAYQEYSISTVLQMLGRAGRPQFDTDATAVIMTRQRDKARYQALVEGTEPLQSYLHKRLAENLNSEAALGTVGDVAQCVQWLRSTFLYVRSAKDPKRYLGLSPAAPSHQISKKIEEMCVRAMNGLASSGLISMDEASCIASTEAGRLMSIFYLDLETMKIIMKIQGTETLDRLLNIICESHELADMHLRVDERRCLNSLNRNNTAATIRYPMKGKINSRQMKLNCIIQAVLGCLQIPDPSLNQEAMKIMRTANRICKCLVAYVTRPEVISEQRQYFSAVLNSIILAKCVEAHLWENSPYVSKQLKGIGPTFSTLLATAGKSNFLLLEESHPRDLERIMNKGPPAGNVLRKQVGLLPKYQLEATPIDEKTVSIRLLLLNQAYLSENMEDLTAGEAHKCYVIAGDSENHLLLFNTFKDSDLISVFNGTMTFQITRKHDFEHKISVHCVSSTFVGIDANCEYTFMDLMPSVPPIRNTASAYFKNKETPMKQPVKVGLNERKRKNNDDEITQSKEKKKRELAIAEKFRLLKESFSKTSNQLKDDLQKTERLSEMALNGLVQTNKPDISAICEIKDSDDDIFDELTRDNNFKHDDDFDAFMDTEKFDNILNEIETEIMSNNQNLVMPNNKPIDKSKQVGFKRQSGIGNRFAGTNTSNKRMLAQKEPNFKFIELLERNTNLSDDDCEMQNKDNGFSAAIKAHLDKYLQSSRNTATSKDSTFKELYEEPELHQDKVNLIINTETSTKNYEEHEVNDMNIELDKTYETESVYETYPNTMPRPVYDQSSNNVEKQIIALSDESLKTLSKEKTVDLELYDKNTDPERNAQDIDASRTITVHSNVCNDYPIALLASADDKTMQLAPRDSSELVNILNENALNIPNFNVDNLKEKRHELESSNDVSGDNKYDETEKYTSEALAIEAKKSSPTKNPNLQILPNHNELCKYNIEKNFENSIPQKLPSLPHFYNVPRNDIEHKNAFDRCAIDSPQRFQNPYFTFGRNKPCNSDTNNHQTNKQENKYIFSAEKVDVQSRVTAEHEIRIIRKLKIDLDVTETIVEDKVNFNSTTMNQKDTNNVSNNLSETGKENEVLIHDLHDKSDNFQIMAHRSYDDTSKSNKIAIEPPINNQFTENNKNNSDISMISDEVDKEKNKLEIRIYKNDNIPCHKSKYKNDDPYQSQLAIEPVDNELGKECKSKSELHMQSNKVDHEQNNSTMNTNNTVENILQKYSKMLSKTDHHLKPSSFQSTSIYDNKKLKPIKSNKPFKITDIQNLDIQLDKVCDPPKHELEFETTNNIPLPKEVVKSPTNVEKVQVEDPVEYDCTQYSSVSLNEPNYLAEDTFTINHAMLDPKTLLKCYNNDDDSRNLEVIPPPPEFSDYAGVSVYSPQLDNEMDTDIHLIEQDASKYEDDYSNYCNTIIEDNVNDGEVDITPSKEVETWTLSIGDDFENNSFSTHLQQRSDIAINRKPNINNIEKYDNYLMAAGGLPRLGKLTQFKFHRKNKFKANL